MIKLNSSYCLLLFFTACFPILEKSFLENLSLFQYLANGSHTVPTLNYYGSPYTFTLGLPISPLTANIAGKVTNCNSNPSLPPGLSLDNTTCEITGTPTTNQSVTSYTITASNNKGIASASIGIIINTAQPSNLNYGSSSYSFSNNFAISTLTPSFTGTVSSCGSSPTLPTGLSLSSNCTITGTPTIPQVSTAYTITATNPYGSTTVNISIAIVASPVITLSVSGLQLNDTLSITELVNFPGTPTVITGSVGSPVTGTITLTSGSNYNIKLGSFTKSSSNSDKICAAKEIQFANNITAPLTINITCTTGFIVGGRFQALPPAALNYKLYQGKVSNLINGLLSPTSIVYNANILYFGDYTTGGGICTGVGYCIYSAPATGGTASAIVTGLTGAVRGITTDGTNLYFTTLNPANTLYKVPLAGGTPIAITTGFTAPFGLVTDGTFIFVADANGNAIKKITIETGGVTTLVTTTTPTGIELVGTDIYFTSGNAIYKVPKTGGTPSVAYGGLTGFKDDIGTLAEFTTPHDLVYDGANNLFVSDFTGGNRIRKIDLRTQKVSTLAGDGNSSALTFGIGAKSQLPNPVGITTDGRNLFVTGHNFNNSVVKISDNGLVGYWPITPGVNPNDYNNDSSALNNGSVSSGLGTTTDRFILLNLASTFSGQEITNSSYSGLPSGASARSECAWIKPTTLPTGTFAVILSYGVSPGATNSVSGFALYNASSVNYISFFGFGNDLNVPYTTSTSLWTHICGTYDGVIAKIYTNGHLIGSTPIVGWTTPASGVLKIGAQVGAVGYQGFNGAIADVRIYNRALNEGEINELAQDALSTNVGNTYNSGGTGLLSHFTFNSAINSGNAIDSGPLALIAGQTGGNIAVIGKDGDPAGAYNLNGASQYFSATSSAGLPPGSHPRTMCAWVKPKDYPSPIYSFIRYGDSGSIGGCSHLMMQQTSGIQQIAFGSCGSSSAEYASVNYQLPLNTWSHICGTLAASNVVNVHVNGSIVSGTTGITTNWQTAPAGLNLQIANFDGTGGYNYNGSIDDVRIYNSALTTSQIRQIAAQVPKGILARYDFKGNTLDVSGFNNSLTSAGSPALTTDRFGNTNSAFSFNGFSKFFTSAPVTTSNSGDVTLSAWIRPTAFNTGLNYIIVNGTGSNGYGILIDGSAGNVLKGILGGVTYISSSVAPPLNVWSHVTLHASGTNWDLRLNGVSIAILAATTPNTPTTATYIGSDAGTGYFTGDIDDVRIYNCALTIPEIRALSGYHPMQVTTWNTTPIVSSLKFHYNATSLSNNTNGAAIPNWNDLSGNAYHLNAAVNPTFSTNIFGTKPGVTFTGTNSFSLAGVSFVTSDFTFFSIQTNDQIDVPDRYILGFNGTSTLQISTVGGASPYGISICQALVLCGATGTSVATGTAFISTIQRDPILSRAYLNGNTPNSLAFASIFTTPGSLYIGSSNLGANYFQGKMGELLMFNGQLNAASVYGATWIDRNIVECYLSSNYSIPLAPGLNCP